jgi:endonuclease YncB( thermonuclease family)
MARRGLQLLLTLCTMVALPAPAAETIEGRIMEVGAGDTATLELAGGIRRSLRLHAVAAPTGRQPYAADSRRALAAMVQGKTVRFVIQREDDYRRLIGKLLVAPPDCAAPCAPTRDAGLAQLEAGLAWWYREERKQQTLPDQGYYEYAEFDARQQRRGLWQDASPVSPWEWRKRHGGAMARALPPPFTPNAKPVAAEAGTGFSL